MDGFLNIYKEAGMTSHDVVNKIRKIFNTKKVGHAGTLDPNATGVLVVAVGRATKAIEYIENVEKIYRAELILGLTTDTEDIWGNILSQCEVALSSDEIINAVTSFIGEIKQIPPMYSALKFNGQKLYELARKGIEVERKARNITIYDIYDIELNNNKVKFTVKCSKGTYIRTLCKDIGEKLKCGAVMSSLERVCVGNFDINNSYKLDELTEESFIGIEESLPKFKTIRLYGDDAKKYQNGIKFSVNFANDKYKIYLNDVFYGIAMVEEKVLKSEKKI